ncbi:hypothetical protein, partial [Mesorhizobium sp. M7A.F.Ca.US.014.04.1.1]|uniref:hypothetical protein n=1 Tax=Mesorhizobium sp. M7A.F.Ca.US.014.04.1.1 TaxID=2496744 RepID=UPI0019D0768B
FIAGARGDLADLRRKGVAARIAAQRRGAATLLRGVESGIAIRQVIAHSCPARSELLRYAK